MAKKQFDNVVSNITRPHKERVTSMTELLDDEKTSSVNTSIKPAQLETTEVQRELAEQEKSRGVTSLASHTINSYVHKLKTVQQQISVNQENMQEHNMVIRDGFSMPAQDYQLIEILKKEAMLLGHDINKSEILRAGLQTLNKLSKDEFFHVIQGVVRIKPGRKVE